MNKEQRKAAILAKKAIMQAEKTTSDIVFGGLNCSYIGQPKKKPTNLSGLEQAAIYRVRGISPRANIDENMAQIVANSTQNGARRASIKRKSS